jgi:hypothetical protein
MTAAAHGMDAAWWRFVPASAHQIGWSAMISAALPSAPMKAEIAGSRGKPGGLPAPRALNVVLEFAFELAGRKTRGRVYAPGTTERSGRLARIVER